MQQFYCPITPSTASQSCSCTQRWHGSSRVVAPDCARFVSSAGSRFGTALRCAEQRLRWLSTRLCHSCVYLVNCPILFRQESSKRNYITIFAYVFTMDSTLHQYESIIVNMYIQYFDLTHIFPDSAKGCERNGNVSCHSGDFTAAVEPRFKYENKKSFTRRTKDLRIVARNGSMQTPILHGAGMDLEPHLHIFSSCILPKYGNIWQLDARFNHNETLQILSIKAHQLISSIDAAQAPLRPQGDCRASSSDIRFGFNLAAPHIAKCRLTMVNQYQPVKHYPFLNLISSVCLLHCVSAISTTCTGV